MQLRRGRGLEALAPAKLNLFLEVLDKRADGYHEIETLMVSVSLYDTLGIVCPDAPGQASLPAADTTTTYNAPPAANRAELEAGGGQVDLIIRSADAGSPRGDAPADKLPEGSDNIVVRAVELLGAEAGVAHSARLWLLKRVPMAAGLAGGSSDAATALRLANTAWQLHWPRERLASVAARLGSDIPFFLGSGAAVCRGRGERIEPAPGLGRLHFVVVKPPVGLSTADVYRACRPAAKPRSVGPLLDALRHGRIDRAANHLHNQLQPAAAQLTPWIHRLAGAFDQTDCLGHQMSGSGTSYFGICRSAIHARRLAARLGAQGLGRVFAVASSKLPTPMHTLGSSQKTAPPGGGPCAAPAPA